VSGSQADGGAAHRLGGDALRNLGQFEAAIRSYDEAIRIAPGSAEAYYGRGLALQAMKQLEAAVANYDKAIALRGDYAEAYHARRIATKQLKKMEAAIASYSALRQLDRLNASLESTRPRPNQSEAYFNCADSLRMAGEFTAAVSSYDMVLSIEPDCAQAYCNRGLALHELRLFGAAVESYDRAISLRPDDSVAHCNRGHALQALGQLDAALACYDKAIALAPDNTRAYLARASALRQAENLDGAVASYDQVIALDPEHAEAHWAKSLTLLAGGNFAEGWALHEWRWKVEGLMPARRAFPQPVWLGKEPLGGKTILLYGEQGLGDTIQFCRYAKLVSDLGARVILEVKRPLLSLLQGLNGVDQLIERGNALPAFDYHVSLMSLPLALKTNLDSVPSPHAYLHVDKGRSAEWSRKLGTRTKPRVGIAWSSTSTFKSDSKRSLPFAEFRSALVEPGLQYLCLQKEIKEIDKGDFALHGDIGFFGEDLLDFGETAALIDNVDLVVSTCTSVAHLSAALGKRTWILLSNASDWRWMLDRQDSPWYESVRLYRQGADEPWGEVLTRIRHDLSGFLRGER
jgi:tetratricopeptide (TPR) repeat protein